MLKWTFACVPFELETRQKVGGTEGKGIETSAKAAKKGEINECSSFFCALKTVMVPE